MAAVLYHGEPNGASLAVLAALAEKRSAGAAAPAEHASAEPAAA